jgi:adenylyl-sulfate kinase
MNLVVPHEPKISYDDRCAAYQQEGKIIWFTGLSGAGKTTLATALEKKLIQQGRVVCLLDGDTLRNGLNSDLDFSNSARKENIRRFAELAKVLAKQSLIVLVSVISPNSEMRAYAKEIAQAENLAFAEIYVKASLDACLKRDPKGFYKKALAGKIKNYTGIESSYEEPANADLVLNTEELAIDDCVEKLLNL